MRFISYYKTDKLYFLGNIIGAIAKGALSLGKKLVTKIKDNRLKKVNKAAEKLLAQKERLNEAEQLVADSGVNGKGVSGFASILNMVKKAKGESTVDPELVNQVDKGGSDTPPWLKYVAMGIGALVLLKVLKIIK